MKYLNWSHLLFFGLVAICFTIYLRGKSRENNAKELASPFFEPVEHLGNVSAIHDRDRLVLRLTNSPVFLSPPPTIAPISIASTFVVKNSSLDKLTLKKKSASCGCTKAVKQFEELSSGAVGEIQVELATRYQYEKERVEAIEYETNDPQGRRLRLEMQVDCYPRIEIDSPKTPPVVQVGATQVVKIPITLYQPSSEPVEQVFVEAVGEGVTVAMEPESPAEISAGVHKRNLVAAVTLAAKQSGASSVINSFATGQVKVRVGKYEHSDSLVWKLGHPVALIPTQLFFRFDKGSQELQKKTIVLEGKEEFQIREIVGKSGVMVAFDKELVAKTHEVEVTLNPQGIKVGATNVFKEKLEVMVSHLAEPLDVPLLLLFQNGELVRSEKEEM